MCIGKSSEKLRARPKLAFFTSDPTPMMFFVLVIVGDGAVGVTSFLLNYMYGTFNEDSPPTIFDTFSHSCKFQEETIQLK